MIGLEESLSSVIHDLVAELGLGDVLSQLLDASALGRWAIFVNDLIAFPLGSLKKRHSLTTIFETFEKKCKAKARPLFPPWKFFWYFFLWKWRQFFHCWKMKIEREKRGKYVGFPCIFSRVRSVEITAPSGKAAINSLTTSNSPRNNTSFSGSSSYLSILSSSKFTPGTVSMRPS